MMAAALIKYIASFSEETIETALRGTVRDDEQDTFEGILKKISDKLEKPPKKKKVEKRVVLPSDKTIFHDKIVPQIRAKLAEYEQQEDSGVDVKWNFNINYNTDFSSADLAELKVTHMIIMKEEQTVRNLELVVVFHRGLVYLLARNYAPVDVNIKEWFSKEFGVSYVVALRYQAFASLIVRYPRLIICGLTFSQILKHKDSILCYLKNDRELAEKLSVAVNISTQNKAVDIFPCYEMYIPKGKFSDNADNIYEHDYACDPVWDSDWEAWMEEATRSGEVFDIIYGNKETEQEGLEDVINSLTVTD